MIPKNSHRKLGGLSEFDYLRGFLWLAGVLCRKIRSGVRLAGVLCRKIRDFGAPHTGAAVGV